MSGQIAIHVSGLVKDYGSIRALDGLDFEVEHGKLTGFLGPNGAGKTTTFRSMLGLTRLDEGHIQIMGMSVPGDLPDLVKQVGAIVEEPGLIKSITGRRNLRVAADTLGLGHDRIDELLDFVELTQDADRNVEQYSKGMRQRLALAAALLASPKLLFLDEPLDGLDPAGQHAFKARLRQLAEDGTTVMVSSHDLADVEALADNVIVINKGKLVAQGPLESLLSASSMRVEGVEGSDAAETLVAAGYEVNVRDGSLFVSGRDGSGIIRALADRGIYPSEVKQARDSLESVFLGMTEAGQ
ncbi:MAG: ABC transporter ATP-binding protein [Actinobacteria bacterium]|nr:MAG: ABC transporter ATP-binding protein [Actinomycetota bacterium]REK40379.1 MAG: ABC transporter ATP-binding protein [Actinomycetota bacterium]